MRSANEKKMFDLLLDEIEDTLQDIEQRCLKLESADQAKELQIIFRAAHNVKGAAQLYGLNDFSGLVHAFEDLLQTLQKNKLVVVAQTVDVLLSAQTAMRGWIQGLREDEKFLPDTSAVKTLLKQHNEELKASIGTTPASTPAAPATQPKPVAAAEGVKPEEKSAAPMPPAPSAEAEPQTVAVPTVSHKSTVPDALQVALQVAPSASLVSKEPVPSPVSPPAPSPAAKTEPRPAAAPAAEAGSAKPGTKRSKRASGTLRIPSQKIDDIMQLIGELSIHQGILWHNYQQGSLNMLNCKNAVVLNQKTLKSLYDIIITLRMQSAESLFQRIERTARDVAREQKKKISIELVGAETPLDKTVVELITDPMMHLVRNAIDHGIEDDETRLKMGKQVPAKLVIRTQQDTGHVLISISDDGRGLDAAMIMEKAVKKGLVAPGTKMKDDEINKLIFLPGFSTRDTVTEISGRGVGMDIVQKAIQQLGGRIEITTKKGMGTTFQIALPASLEIIEGLLIRVGDQVYIVPRQDVTEILDLASQDIEPIGQGGRAIRMRNGLIPVEDLSDYIGVGERAENANRPQDSSKQLALQVILPDHSKLALRIDALIAQQQIVVRPLSDNLANVPGFSGVTILGNGEPTMILSTSAIGESYLRWVRSGDRGAIASRTPKTFGESA